MAVYEHAIFNTDLGPFKKFETDIISCFFQKNSTLSFSKLDFYHKFNDFFDTSETMISNVSLIGTFSANASIKNCRSRYRF